MNGCKHDRQQFIVRFGYFGFMFYGVQEQKQLKTALGALRNRIEDFSKCRAQALVISARTDRGVHAIKNYATFYLKEPVDVPAFIAFMKKHRCDGLHSLSIAPVSWRVHARGISASKTYRYYLRDSCDEPKEGLAWEITPPLCVKSMQEAAHFLVGKMDFSSFRGGGCQAGNTVKCINYIYINRSIEGVISIEINGDAFLRKMIRNIVGLFAEIGAGLREPQEIPYIIEQKHRNAAGIMAPAHGLWLVEVKLLESLSAFKIGITFPSPTRFARKRGGSNANFQNCLSKTQV